MDLKYLRTFVIIFLLPLGIVENTSHKQYDFVYFVIYYSLVLYVTLGIVIGLINTTDIGGIGIEIGQLTTHMTSLVMTLYYKFSVKLVLKLITKLKENGNTWLEAGKKMEQFIGSTVVKVFCGYYLMIIAIVVPIFAGIPNMEQINQKTSFLIPFWYYCGEANETRKFTDTICWQVDDIPELLISNIIQTVLYFLTLHALIMYLLFYTVLTTNVKIHVDVMNENVARMAKQWQDYGWKTARDFETQNRGMERYFRGESCIKFDDILKHQQFIREFTREVTNLLQWMVMINIIGIFSSLTLTPFFTIVEKTNDSLLSSKLASMSIIMIITFFIYCYNAQTITDLNQCVFESMFNIPWYNQSIDFRKKYVIALSLNQKPIHVKACKMYEVNLPMFLSFMKGIYSVINIMKLKYS